VLLDQDGGHTPARFESVAPTPGDLCEADLQLNDEELMEPTLVMAPAEVDVGAVLGPPAAPGG
jgi:hypothetical protein